jgi:hypothetical protein
LTVEPTLIGDRLPAEGVFILYSTGRVIYSTPSGRQNRADWRVPIPYYTVTLTAAEQKALFGDLPLDKVGSWIIGPGGDDGGSICIEVRSHGQQKRDCKWGGIDIGPKAPPDMVKIWKRLSTFESKRATSWKPDATTKPR